MQRIQDIHEQEEMISKPLSPADKQKKAPTLEERFNSFNEHLGMTFNSSTYKDL